MTATATRAAKAPAAGVSVIGKNIQAAVDGNILTLRIDLSARHGESSSGKTIIVATSGGNQAIEGGKGVILGLKPRDSYEKFLKVIGEKIEESLENVREEAQMAGEAHNAAINA